MIVVGYVALAVGFAVGWLTRSAVSRWRYERYLQKQFDRVGFE